MHHSPHAGFFASSTGGFCAGCWMAVREAMTHGPGWALVPPLLFALASLLGAFASARKILSDAAIARAKADQDLRHADELHRARVDRIHLTGRDPGPPVEALAPLS